MTVHATPPHGEATTPCCDAAPTELPTDDQMTLNPDAVTCTKPTEHRQCPHGFHHPPHPHSCDGCWCEGERDRHEYGWPHDTTPTEHANGDH